MTNSNRRFAWIKTLFSASVFSEPGRVGAGGRGIRKAAARPVALALAACALWTPQAAAADDPEIRLVTLAPHLTELVYAAGAAERLVGVVEWSDYPQDARELPRIGDAFRFDLEAVLRLEATHALVWQGGTPAAAIERLESLGIAVKRVETRGLEDIGTAIEAIGEWLGRADGAGQAAGEYRKRLARMRESAQPGAAGIPATVFYQVSERPLYTLGGRHVINEVFALCGARNLFGHLDTEATVVALEAILVADPDAIVAGRDTAAGDPFRRWRRHDGLRAVRCEHLLTVDPELLVRPTPRILDGAKRLCAWLDDLRQATDPACEIDRE